MYNNLNHIALILDGNKRWAKKNNFTSAYGYTKGFENIRNLINFSLSINLSHLTIFALSSENFKRTSINIIYDIIYENFSKIFEEIVLDNDVKIKIFGSRNNLPKKIIDIFDKIEKNSSQNKSLELNIAFNYGFKNEIKHVLDKVRKFSNVNINDSSEIQKLFYLESQPDPDLLIRTGGYKRLSNFIMFNLTYTELFFTDTLWPEFTEEEFKSIIKDYSNIKRKYGL